MTSSGAPELVPGEERRDAGLLARPALAPPNGAVRDGLRRWREAAAAFAWIGRAWLRPAGGEARWEQRAGRESLGSESRGEAGRGAREERPDEPGRSGERQPEQGQTRTTGTGQ